MKNVHSFLRFVFTVEFSSTCDVVPRRTCCNQPGLNFVDTAYLFTETLYTNLYEAITVVSYVAIVGAWRWCARPGTGTMAMAFFLAGQMCPRTLK
uniref:Uncharacterized protein n=1 Tax=Arundo donax TaxID=35708 RepID=A0A0A9EZ53_ARUDO